jgi:uncharacterized membrane protein
LACGAERRGVFLEGLEVVVIVITVGSAWRGALVCAAIGAAAGLIVIFAASLLRHPLSRVPWWHGDVSVFALAIVTFMTSSIAIGLLRKAPSGAGG